MSMDWHQEEFNADIKRYLMQHESSTWPKLVNTRMFFVTLKALRETPPVSPAKIDSELSRFVSNPTREGVGVSVKRPPTIGYAIAAMRAQKHYTGSAFFRGAARAQLAKEMGGRGKGGNYQAAWRSMIKQTYKSMVGGRKASVGFLRAGWVSIVYALSPFVGLSVGSVGRDTKRRSAAKGTVLHLATPSNLNIAIENTAHSQTENWGDFERIGGGALDRAMVAEHTELVRHMEEAMEPGIRDFNSRQK